MKNPQLLKLIDKYVAGGCTPDEELLLEKYLEYLNNENLEWDEKELGDKHFIEEKIYSKIIQKINYNNFSNRFGIISRPSLVKIAASIIIFIALSIGVLYLSGIFKNTANTWAEKKTVPGEKLIVKLADSSEIILNAESKLNYPIAFTGGTREVYLEGEAYFNIKHDPAKPFIVHTANLYTTVLGTKFNVSAFPGESNIVVSLVEGSVKVTEVKLNATGKTSILKPNEKLVYNVKKAVSKVEQFDLQETIGWKDNLLKFNDETLQNVFIKLERAFGVKFEWEQGALKKKYLITTNFKNAPLMTIAEALKKFTGLNYQVVKENEQIKKIIFKQK